MTVATAAAMTVAVAEMMAYVRPIRRSRRRRWWRRRDQLSAVRSPQSGRVSLGARGARSSHYHACSALGLLFLPGARYADKLRSHQRQWVSTECKTRRPSSSRRPPEQPVHAKPTVRGPQTHHVERNSQIWASSDVHACYVGSLNTMPAS